MREPIHLLVSVFDKENKRICDIKTMYEIGGQSFEKTRIDIHNSFMKYINYKKPAPDYAICKILWIRPSKSNIEWATFGSGFTATNNRYYTDLYYYADQKIILAEHVK